MGRAARDSGFAVLRGQQGLLEHITLLPTVLLVW